MSRGRSLRLAAMLGALAGVAEAATVQHAEPLLGLSVAARAGAAKPSGFEPAVVTFNAFSRDFTLELEPNGRLAGTAARPANGVGAYRGIVAGRPQSWARIVLAPAGLSGLVSDGETLYGIDAGGAAADGAPAMFRLADVYFAPGELGCETGAAAIDGEQAFAALADEVTALAAAGAAVNLDLGAVADFEFAQLFGANAEAALLTRLNNVDGLFSEQLGVQVTVAEVDIFTSSDDPFSASAANTLLDQLARYRGDTPSQDAQGLTHLFTGRDLDGSTVGIAFFGAVCATRSRFDARSFGAGLSQARAGNAVVDSLIAAHEIGHTFGAPHDGDANGACAATPTTFLMAPRINGSSTFSECSIEEMQAEVLRAACLAPLGPANVAVTLAPPPAELHAGVSFAQTATVRNDGADAATSVTFTATAEHGLAIVAADSGGAGCTTSPSTATCTLGSVSGGGARGVTLTLRADDAGTFGLAAAVAAAVDADSSDDTAAASFRVLPLVDLVLSGAPPPGAPLNGATTIEASVVNASGFGATAVTVTASLSAGLRPEEAALDGTPCSIAGQALSCPARSLAAGGNAALVVTATGIAAGTQQLTVSVSADEAERSPADNQLAIAVAVSAPAAQSGGGGGAASWFGVLLLLAALPLRIATSARRRRPR
jgi:hypothetical protein